LKTLYLICCLLGVVLPYSQFLPWLLEHGLDVGEFYREAIGSTLGLFAWFDVLISAVVLLTFTDYEARRLGMRCRWAPWVGKLTVGVSLGLPLFYVSAGAAARIDKDRHIK
jgi:hypothetical protein